MAEYYDALETRDPEERERELMAALPRQIALAKERSPHFARLLEKVKPGEITDRRALVDLPVTRKSDLAERQKAQPPFGGLTTVPNGALARIFMSPGPIYDPEGRAPDYWRMARALFAAGFRKGDVVHNSFSYHLTPAGSMLESGAHALGCAVVPGGVGQTELQLRAINDIRPDGYVGTPSFLRILLEKAAETGADVSSISKALVSGEAFPTSLRAEFAGRGINALQCYGTADLGLVAYESEAREGLIVDEGVLVEIVRPGTGDPLPDGEVGEVVVTPLANSDYPVIRFGTGDLSAVLPGTSSCGRTNLRIKGWMGRADQAAKVKGLFVHPGQVADVVRRHPEIVKARLVVDNPDANDRMVLHVEVAPGRSPATEAIVASLRDVTKLRGEVVLHAAGELANDGKVIDDIRKF